MCKQFGLGFYDGITGMVTDPYKGAKKEGGVGFVKGVGRGIVSLPFRIMGGAWAVPGYAMKGLYQEMAKNKGQNVENYIIAARIAQGYEEAAVAPQEEREEIVKRWRNMKGSIKKKKNVGAESIDSLHALVQQKRERKNERLARLNSHANATGGQPLVQDNPAQQDNLVSVDPAPQGPEVEPEIRSTIPSWRQQEAERVRALRRQETPTTGSNTSAASQPTQAELEAQLRAEEEEDQRELERAITASVAEASRGNPEEDELIASAIRASITELERADASTQQDDEEALHRAMVASMSEAGRTNVTEEEQKALEETLRRSLLETRTRRRRGSGSEWDSDNTDNTEEDEEYQRIIAESKELAHLHASHPDDYAQQQQQSSAATTPTKTPGSAAWDTQSTRMGSVTTGGEPSPASNIPTSEHDSGVLRHDEKHDDDDDDEQMKRVLWESQQAERERVQNLERQRTEEEVVLEYVRKQSLLEEEHRRKMMETRAGGPSA